MQAFPKDSKNMALGGSGPINSSLNLDLIHGHTSEGYLDYSATAVSKKGDATFDSARAEVIHGAESMGLGTSTFLEGTPASRSAIQRRQSESENPAANGGLQRTKSLANKFKGINRAGTVRVASPESMGATPSSAGPAIGSSRATERNPFFQDYDEAYDAKGVRIEETVISGRLRASSSPRRNAALERKTTNGSIGTEEIRQNGGSFMNRMKSLRRPRPERADRRVPSE
jgi:Pal1 cell morphology protein